MKFILKSIQYFFWLLAGSDIAVLKKTPTDQTRHANIGLAIFTTTLVAFITGSLAGAQFSVNSDHILRSALIFGGLWSLLVFTIDRNMVLTLKKNPKAKKQKLLIPLLYRVFLSAIISFFISIPLEIWIFKDEIEIQMHEDDDKKILDRKDRLSSIYNLEGLEKYKNQSLNTLDQLKTKQQVNEPPTIEYQDIKENAIDAKNEYDNYVEYYDGRVAERKKWYRKWQNKTVTVTTISSTGVEVEKSVKIRSLPAKQRQKYKDQDHDKFWNIYVQTRENPDGSETIRKNELKSAYKAIESKRQKQYNNYYKEIEIQIKTEDSLSNVINERITANTDSVKVEVQNFDTLARSSSGFISQWVALNNLHNVGENATDSEKNEAFWIVFFIWFIRVVFFTIELLPTLAKFTTPLGAYDWAILEEEDKQRKLSKKEKKKILLKHNKDLKKEIAENKVLQKKSLENFKKKILKKYFKKQNKIAGLIMDNWEKEEMKKI